MTAAKINITDAQKKIYNVHNMSGESWRGNPVRQDIQKEKNAYMLFAYPYVFTKRDLTVKPKFLEARKVAEEEIDPSLQFYTKIYLEQEYLFDPRILVQMHTEEC